MTPSFSLDAEEALHVKFGAQAEVVIPAANVPDLLRVVHEKYSPAAVETGWVKTKQPAVLELQNGLKCWIDHNGQLNAHAPDGQITVSAEESSEVLWIAIEVYLQRHYGPAVAKK